MWSSGWTFSLWLGVALRQRKLLVWSLPWLLFKVLYWAVPIWIFSVSESIFISPILERKLIPFLLLLKPDVSRGGLMYSLMIHVTKQKAFGINPLNQAWKLDLKCHKWKQFMYKENLTSLYKFQQITFTSLIFIRWSGSVSSLLLSDANGEKNHKQKTHRIFQSLSEK